MSLFSRRMKRVALIGTGFVLFLFGLFGAFFGLLSIADPVGTQMANDSIPLGNHQLSSGASQSLGCTWLLPSSAVGYSNADSAFPTMQPNYALERSVRSLAIGAAGASESLAPEAPGSALPRPAQRGR